MPDPKTMADMLDLADLLRRPVMLRAIESLGLPPGSRGLDVGCGVGSNVPLLLEGLGKKGYVEGVDLNSELVIIARERARRGGYSGRSAFCVGDMNRVDSGDDAFDWAFSVDCVGYPSGNPLPALREMKRVVRPGGTVAILGWTSQRILPGHPLLEDRLNGNCSLAAPFLRGQEPRNHFMRSIHGFREVGLKDPGARSFLGEVHGPLEGETRRALISLMDMLWQDPPVGLTEDEMDEYRRIRRADSEDFILGCPEYYAFFTYTMFHGTV
jgi:demethylmenaquinone methyltransferase/2-methoxy-6-polyprenyl-1,4-benzoquinol methylase